MMIGELFATSIQERIEPVVKVADRSPAVLTSELASLVVTPQWEQHLRRILDTYVEAIDRNDEQRIGIWISGFFGSGKSLLLKVLGSLLEGGELAGTSVHERFLSRLTLNSADRRELERLLTIIARQSTALAVGGNLHAMLAAASDSLALITFKLFAQARQYTHNWALAWAVEYHLDQQGRTETFRQHAAALNAREGEEVAQDADFYADYLYRAAADSFPKHFRSPDAVAQAVTSAAQNGIDARMLI